MRARVAPQSAILISANALSRDAQMSNQLSGAAHVLMSKDVQGFGRFPAHLTSACSWMEVDLHQTPVDRGARRAMAAGPKEWANRNLRWLLVLAPFSLHAPSKALHQPPLNRAGQATRGPGGRIQHL
jgi:hypothetical protein